MLFSFDKNHVIDIYLEVVILGGYRALCQGLANKYSYEKRPLPSLLLKTSGCKLHF